jgi:HAD superfamily hydrolase (TIGR01549 family)
MDGVLLEGRGTDEAVHDRALEDALADCGLDPDPETRALLDGYEYDTDFATGCKRLGVDPVAFYDLRERHSTRRVLDRLRSGTRTPYPDVEAIEDLAERYTLGVVSNNYHEVVEFVTEHHEIDGFSYVRGRDTGVQGFYRRKPDPHYLLEAVDALGGERGFYVGDRSTDVVAATRAGLDTVFVRRPHNRETTLSPEPTMEVDSLSTLASRL